MVPHVVKGDSSWLPLTVHPLSVCMNSCTENWKKPLSQESCHRESNSPLLVHWPFSMIFPETLWIRPTASYWWKALLPAVPVPDSMWKKFHSLSHWSKPRLLPYRKHKVLHAPMIFLMGVWMSISIETEPFDRPCHEPGTTWKRETVYLMNLPQEAFMSGTPSPTCSIAPAALSPLQIR